MSQLSKVSASDYFGSMVRSYDSLIRRAVPRYDEMTQRLIEYLPPTANHIIELGCGTGNLSLRLAQRYPSARLTLVDAAPEMIDLTRGRLKSAHPKSAERAAFITSRFEDLALDPKSFDLATSCISLHHVRCKAPLYKVLHGALRPGGTFRFADQLRGSTQWIHDHNWARWLEFCRMPEHCTEEEVQSLLEHAAAHDFYTPLAEHFRLLEAAGFVHPDCVWRNWIWGVVTADRE